MVISRWDPWGELASLQRDVQELFGRTSAPTGRRASGIVPPMDAFRADDGSLTIRLELPGMRPEDVEINYSRGVLTVAGQRSSEQEVSQDNWIRRERSVGTITRSISLSENIDPSSISANFENGVLELRIPPAPEERATRIPVSASGQSQTVDVGEAQQTTEGEHPADTGSS
jgi:HSP20 family protein